MKSFKSGKLQAKGMPPKNKGAMQSGQLEQMLERLRTQNVAKAADIAAQDALKKAEEASRKAAEAAEAATAHEQAQVSLSGSTAAAALLVPCLLLCAYVSPCRRPTD